MTLRNLWPFGGSAEGEAVDLPVYGVRRPLWAWLPFAVVAGSALWAAVAILIRTRIVALAAPELWPGLSAKWWGLASGLLVLQVVTVIWLVLNRDRQSTSRFRLAEGAGRLIIRIVFWGSFVVTAMFGAYVLLGGGSASGTGEEQLGFARLFQFWLMFLLFGFTLWLPAAVLAAWISLGRVSPSDGRDVA